MGRAAALALILAPLAAIAAPVPVHLMPRIVVQLRYDPDCDPLGASYEIAIRNDGTSDLPIWSDRPHGVAAFLDYEIVNARGDRVSRFSPWRMPPEPDAKLVLCRTIAAKSKLTTGDAVFNFVDEKKLIPGRYRVRVHFDYKDQRATSDWVDVDISESQIRTKKLSAFP